MLRIPSRFHFAVALVAGSALVLGACAGDDESAFDSAERDESSTFSSAGADGVAVAPAGSMPDFAPQAGEGLMAPEESKGGATFTDQGGVQLPSVLGRTILRSGSVALTVESVSDSFERVRQVAEGAGGYVSDSSFYGSGDTQSASMTLRVPADQFGQVVADLRSLAIEVDAVQTSSQDVTEEFTDLESTLRNLQAVEAQYLTLLGQAETITDILTVQDRLASVRLQIEQTQGRINMLDNLASLATLSVTLSPESGVAQTSKEGSGFVHEVRQAWESSLEAIAAVGTGIAVAVVWSWWLLPLIPVAWVGGRWLARRLSRPQHDVDTPVASA